MIENHNNKTLPPHLNDVQVLIKLLRMKTWKAVDARKILFGLRPDSPIVKYMANNSYLPHGYGIRRHSASRRRSQDYKSELPTLDRHFRGKPRPPLNWIKAAAAIGYFIPWLEYVRSERTVWPYLPDDLRRYLADENGHLSESQKRDIHSIGGRRKQETGVGAEFKRRVILLFKGNPGLGRKAFIDLVLETMQCDTSGLDARWTYTKYASVPFKLKSFDYVVRVAGEVYDHGREEE